MVTLFWCSTSDGAEDYWVVAADTGAARGFFAATNGFPRSRVSVEAILNVPSKYSSGYAGGPCTPTTADLERWFDILYNQNFHVFYYKGRIFRPQASLRKLLMKGEIKGEDRKLLRYP